MPEAGVETEVVHRLLFAGPSAASFVERQLEKERPDFVVIALSTYGVVVQLVSNRLRERFGQPVASAAERFERFVSRHPARHGSNQERALTAIRRGGRRLIGTRPSLTLSRATPTASASWPEQRTSTLSSSAGRPTHGSSRI